jgi:hypothetical protein
MAWIRAGGTFALRLWQERRIVTVSQRNIELLIGRLLTDETFRIEFVRHLTKALATFIDSGHELTAHEIQALVASNPSLWNDIAAELDPRLRKVDA